MHCNIILNKEMKLNENIYGMLCKRLTSHKHTHTLIHKLWEIEKMPFYDEKKVYRSYWLRKKNANHGIEWSGGEWRLSWIDT